MKTVLGKFLDKETRCKHYAYEKDINVIKFDYCIRYYHCCKCHWESVDHALQKWQNEKFNTKAILCGVCRTEMTIETYMNHNACPECGSVYNENCQLHYPIYFDV